MKVSPSVLAADFANLQKEIERVHSADMLHLDIMDGHFVPNISFGIPVVKSVSKATDLFLDVHLMISHPKQYIPAFCDAGADSICFHLESEDDPQEVISLIHSHQKQCAIAIKPGTPVEAVYPYLPDLNMVLIMTVEPGFGGQSFMHLMLEKITKLKTYASSVNPALAIQVDGGINRETAKLCADAGVTVLVAGTCIFAKEDAGQEIAYFQSLGR